MRELDRTAQLVHQDSDDIPTGTLRSIERQGEAALGRKWLRKGFLHD